MSPHPQTDPLELARSNPSHLAWLALCVAVDEMAAEEVRELSDDLRDALRTWPSELRVAPSSWMYSALNPEFNPRLKLCSVFALPYLGVLKRRQVNVFLARLRACKIHRLHLRGVDIDPKSLRTFLASKAIAGVAHLSLPGAFTAGNSVVQTIATHSNFANLRSLDLSHCSLDNQSLGTIIGSTVLHNLRELRLDGNPFDSAGVAGLLLSHWPQLCNLSLVEEDNPRRPKRVPIEMVLGSPVGEQVSKLRLLGYKREHPLPAEISTQRSMNELRDAAFRPSRQAWDTLANALDRVDPQDRQVASDYIKDHTAQWPPSLLRSRAWWFESIERQVDPRLQTAKHWILHDLPCIPLKPLCHALEVSQPSCLTIHHQRAGLQSSVLPLYTLENLVDVREIHMMEIPYRDTVSLDKLAASPWVSKLEKLTMDGCYQDTRLFGDLLQRRQWPNLRHVRFKRCSGLTLSVDEPDIQNKFESIELEQCQYVSEQSIRSCLQMLRRERPVTLRILDASFGEQALADIMFHEVAPYLTTLELGSRSPQGTANWLQLYPTPLANLQRLDLRNLELRSESMENLTRLIPSDLRSFALSKQRSGDMARLVDFPFWGQVEDVELSHVNIEDRELAAILAKLGTSLKTLRLRNLSHFGPLSQLALVALSERATQLQELHLDNLYRLHGRTLAHFFRSFQPVSLRTLRLDHLAMDTACVRILARAPWMATLERLTIGGWDADLSSRLALANSPHLADALRRTFANLSPQLSW